MSYVSSYIVIPGIGEHARLPAPWVLMSARDDLSEFYGEVWGLAENFGPTPREVARMLRGMTWRDPGAVMLFAYVQDDDDGRYRQVDWRTFNGEWSRG